MELKQEIPTPHNGEAGRNAVARVVWPWVAISGPHPARPSRHPFRRAALQAIWIVAVGLVLYHRFDRRLAGCLLFGFATFLPALAILAPGGYRAFDRGVLRLAEWFGRALNVLILAPFFYMVFTAGRLFLRLAGRDPMGRAFPAPGHPSFWTSHKERTDPAFYKRQH